MAAFETKVPVLFRHCDVAGIVFYPRYVEMVNDIIERWFEQGLNCAFIDLHMNRKLGIPTVRLEVDYRAPSSLGDVLDFSLTVRELRTRAFSVKIVGKVGDTVCIVSKSTLVFVQSGNAFKGEEAMKSTPIPDDIRTLMESFKEDPSPDQIQIAEAS